MKLNFTSIIIVVIAAAIGFVSITNYIKNNLVQYSSLPKTITFNTYDDSTCDSADFVLPVISKSKVDTFKKPQSQYHKGDKKMSNSLLFHTNQNFMIWVMSISLLTTFCAAIFVIFIGLIYHIRNRYNLSKSQLLYATIGTLIILTIINFKGRLPGYFYPPDIINHFHILLKNGNVLNNIEKIIAILASPMLVVFFLLAVASDNIKLPEIPIDLDVNNADLIKKIKEKLEESSNDFAFLNAILKIGINNFSVIIALTIVCSGLLGLSITSVIEITGLSIYPSQVSLIYGLFFSLLLGIIFIPLNLFLKYKTTPIIEIIEKAESIGLINAVIAAKLMSKLKTETSMPEKFKTVLTILTPLISSIIPAGLNFLSLM